jgi:hypothetical protein
MGGTVSYQLLSVLVGLIALVSGLVALRQARTIAKLQGAYKTERLRLIFYGEPVIDDYVVALPGVATSPCLLPLEVGIANEGDRTAEEIELYIRMTDMVEFIPGELETAGGRPTGQHFGKTAHDGYYSVNGVTLGSLHPTKSVGLQLLVAIPPKSDCLHPISVPCTTKDGYKITFNATLLMHPFLEITILAKHQLPTRRRVNLYFIDCDEATTKRWFEVDGRKFSSLYLGAHPLSGTEKRQGSRTFKLVTVQKAKESKDTEIGAHVFTGRISESACAIPSLRIEVPVESRTAG